MKAKLFLKVMAIIVVIALTGCEKDYDPTKPGMLTPKTVEQDPSLPSISVNGTQLHAESFGDPDSAMIVFLHGGPGADYRNAIQVKQLAANGYHVVFYDQRGSGLSKRHDKNSYTIQLLLDDLAAVIQHYRTSANQKIFLFGHSWGAILATAYINAYPLRIHGAILAEPGGFTYESIKQYIKNSKKLSLFAEFTNNALYADQFLTGRENQHEILDYKVAIAAPFTYAKDNIEGIEGPSPFWRYGAVVLNAMLNIAEKDGFDFTTNLDQFTKKVLFLYGENNRAYGLDFVTREAANYPHTEIAKINGTGHEMIYFKWNIIYPLALQYFNSLK